MSNNRLGVWAAVFLVALAGCGHGGGTSRPQRPSNAAENHPRIPLSGSAPSPAPTSSTMATSTAPIVTPSAVSSPFRKKLSALLPQPPRKVPRRAPNDAPQILRVAISETTVQSGDRIVGSVVTTSNVASVEARIGGYSMSLAKVGVGRFELAYTVGSLPWFVHGTFTMQLIARNTRGDAVVRAFPLNVR